MEAKNKKRILLGLIILLVLINLSAIVTIGYNKYDRRKSYDKEYIDKSREKRTPHNRMKLYVKKELELSDNQFNSYCGLKDGNLKRSEQFIRKIRVYKKGIITEINKKNPDSLILLKYSDSVGTQHKLLQMEMNRHFIAIKQILEPEQVVKFEKLLNRMDDRFRPNRKRKYKNKEGRSPDKQHRHRNKGKD